MIPTDTTTMWENEVCSALNVEGQPLFDYTNYSCALPDNYTPYLTHNAELDKKATDAEIFREKKSASYINMDNIANIIHQFA